MIVSVEDKYEALYNELRGMGYKVYRFSDNMPSDVVIYCGSSTHLTSLNASTITNASGGTFLINGDNKSAAEIDDMIRNKSYTSLFKQDYDMRYI